MGFPQTELNVPIMKGSNGVIAIDTDTTEAQECIKCGRCVDVCPMELKPLYFCKFAGAQDWQSCKDYNIMDCMECRCCEYICSSKLPLVTMIKMGKNGVRGLK
jgi:electron transport complex protein RnfC